MRHRIITSALVAGAIGIGAVATVACSSGPSAPPTATQILQSNGYTYDASFTQQLEQGISLPAGTTMAAGESGSNLELAVVTTSPADASAAASSIQSQGDSGLTLTTNGDVVTVVGPLTTWAADGN